MLVSGGRGGLSGEDAVELDLKDGLTRTWGGRADEGVCTVLLKPVRGTGFPEARCRVPSETASPGPHAVLPERDPMEAAAQGPLSAVSQPMALPSSPFWLVSGELRKFPTSNPVPGQGCFSLLLFCSSRSYLTCTAPHRLTPHISPFSAPRQHLGTPRDASPTQAANVLLSMLPQAAPLLRTAIY